ncbi:MAG: CBS domain-containing protein [Crocinitomicaceae bacterium]|nr:CBS domain-containing protein [Crocinitomicaceae bacterium]
MKISASIYSDKSRSLKEVIDDLVNHQVDMLHVDCNDDLTVFDDIKRIKSWCDLPIDLHIITDTPSKYYPYLEENPVDYVTFQYENLKEELNIPKTIKGKKGLAIITPTPIDVFSNYQDFDFILIMATIPGQSGGIFDKINFDKIRKFRNKFPAKSIHVDGGVNGEVSFILRNMGVTSSVSGSYLFKGPSIGHQLMNLIKRKIESKYRVEDFMTPIEECPVVEIENLTFKQVIQSIEQGNLGFTLVVGKNNHFEGLISNADVRKALIKHVDDFNKIEALETINQSPVTIADEATVIELLKTVKKTPFIVSYLPVLDAQKRAVGVVNFANLIKAEL